MSTITDAILADADAALAASLEGEPRKRLTSMTHFMMCFERLAREETPVTPDTALRLSRYFGTTPEFWLGLQARHDIEVAARALRRELTEITPRSAA